MLAPVLTLYFQNQENPAGGFLCLGVVVIIIIALVASSNRKNKELAEAKASYEASLSKLKSNPTNADLRQTTLQLGRIYSNLTRRKKGVTLFDEVALMNDINAACAGATFVSRSTSAPAESSIEKRLAKLAELKSKGVIDEQEYTSTRQRIIDEV
jgi:hypothetical protein